MALTEKERKRKQRARHNLERMEDKIVDLKRLVGNDPELAVLFQKIARAASQDGTNLSPVKRPKKKPKKQKGTNLSRTKVSRSKKTHRTHQTSLFPE